MKSVTTWGTRPKLKITIKLINNNDLIKNFPRKHNGIKP